MERVPFIASKHRDSTETVSDTERQIGGIIHAVINENMPIEEAEARIKLIAELNVPDHPTADS